MKFYSRSASMGEILKNAVLRKMRGTELENPFRTRIKIASEIKLSKPERQLVRVNTPKTKERL